MKILDVRQGSPEWLAARMGLVTASELKYLLTPKCEPRKWSTEMPNTYLASKLSEKWSGEPDEGFVTEAMENGSIREKQAVPWYEGIFEVRIHPVGFIITDEGTFGASPDGMFDDGAGIEVKVPKRKTHTKYLLADGVPDEYLPQVHGCIFATGAAYWKFLSWNVGFPNHIVTVERDEAAMLRIAEAVADFSERFRRGFERMVDMNWGELPAPPKFETEIGANGTVTRRVADHDSPLMDKKCSEWFQGAGR